MDELEKDRKKGQEMVSKFVDILPDRIDELHKAVSDARPALAVFLSEATERDINLLRCTKVLEILCQTVFYAGYCVGKGYIDL